jgi:hypothetical protein
LICVGDQWVAAVYDVTGPGIKLTSQQEDACSWVSHDKAAGAARVVSAFFKEPAWIYVSQEADYPASWKVQRASVAG